MKRFYTYLFLILFSFSAPTFADDIRDFQIEGMSIGDSLLDYFSEEKIIKQTIPNTHPFYLKVTNIISLGPGLKT